MGAAGGGRAAAAAEPESKLDALTSAHGVTRDVAQRYLLAANDDLAATHRLLQTTRVRELGCSAETVWAACHFVLVSNDTL